ncbi:MAG: cell wall-binding repeat-containing protein [Actinomycetota bacterium]|nr:cell wall-binding repeat-containing protein [Actinomycetota bacterium]
MAVAPSAQAVVGQVRASGDYPLAPTANPLASRAKDGPGLAINPANPKHIVETHQELETEECEFNASFDGGSTWAGGTLEAPADFPGQGQSLPGPCSLSRGAVNIGQKSAAFGSANNVYVTWTSSRGPGAIGYSVLLSKSTDGGATFPPAVPVPGMEGGANNAPDFEEPELVVDPRTAAPGDDQIFIFSAEAATGRALVVRSDDAGATFQGPFEASNTGSPSPQWNAENTAITAAGDAYKQVSTGRSFSSTTSEHTQPVLGPAPPGGGNRPLYVAWRAIKSGPCPPNCEGAGETAADAYLVVAKSTDLGATWTRVRAVNLRGFLSPAGTVHNGGNQPRLAAGPDGNVYVTFNQGPGVKPSDNCGVGPFPAGAPGAGATGPCPRYTGEGYSASAASFKKADHFIHWDLDVWFIRSTDGGTTWGDLKQLNEPKKPGLAATEITQTRHPQISVSLDGRVDVLWQDRRHWYISPSARRGATIPGGTGQFRDPAGNVQLTDLGNYPCVQTHAPCEEARLGDTYHAWSSDGGATFGPNRRVNDRSHNNDVGYDYRFSTYWDYGPAVVASGTDQLLVADMDARLGNVETDSLDIFLRRVNVNAGNGPIPVDNAGTANAPSYSVALSQRMYPGGSEAVLAGTFASRPATRVVIVNEADMPSALAAGVLARANLGPVLASPPGGLPADVRDEVNRLVRTGAVGAFVIGNTTALSGQVEADLAGAGVPGAQITRIGGASPADVAANIAATLDRRTLAERTSDPPLAAFDGAIIANPNSASAASASALAANRRLPILFVDRDSVPAATAEALRARNITKTLVVGSTGVISSGVESQLPNPTRLGGGDQFATSNSVLAESVARGLPRNMVYVADGNEPMQGALLGATVARMGGLLTLTPGGDAGAAESNVNAFGLRPHVDRIVASNLTATAAVGPDPGDVVGPGPGPGPGTGDGTTSLPTGFNGYRMVAGDGGIFTFGARNFHGSTGDIRLNKPIVGGATDLSDYDGYWMVASDGGIFAFNAEFHGSLGGQTLSAPAVEIEPTPTGKGYFIVLADGTVRAFGDAVHVGDFSGQRLNKPVIGMSVTTTGQGYWLVAEDGGIFNFGDAPFLGSTGGTRLNAPVIDLAPQVDNQGYYLVARDGGVFTFGSAEFKGSTGDIKLNAPVVAMLVAPNGAGYWLAATDGGVFTFGAVEFLGSTGDIKLNSPVLDLIN